MCRVVDYVLQCNAIEVQPLGLSRSPAALGRGARSIAFGLRESDVSVRVLAKS
jgi:hypothetical protein